MAPSYATGVAGPEGARKGEAAGKGPEERLGVDVKGGLVVGLGVKVVVVAHGRPVPCGFFCTTNVKRLERKGKSAPCNRAEGSLGPGYGGPKRCGPKDKVSCGASPHVGLRAACSETN